MKTLLNRLLKRAAKTTNCISVKATNCIGAKASGCIDKRC